MDEASIAAAAVSASLPLVVSATVASLPLPATAKPRAPKGFNNRRGVFCEDCKLKCVSASLRVCPCVSLCVPLCLMCTGRSRSANYGLPDGTGKRKRWCDPTSTSPFPSPVILPTKLISRGGTGAMAATQRVGNLLGAGDPARARVSARAAT